MLLVADVGNSRTHLGLYDGARLVASGDVPTREVHELEASFDRFAERPEVAGARVTDCVIGSVNPKVKMPLARWVERRFGVRPRTIGADVGIGIANRADNPEEVGADRLLNALAAHRRHGGPTVVVDFGTAITFDVVSAQGEYLGGLILPGLRTMARSLAEHTALLPYVRVEPCEKVIGRNTIDSINRGLYWGVVGLVGFVLGKLDAEIGGRAHAIATGGDAAMVAAVVPRIDAVDPYLTLEGLRLAHEEHVRGGAGA